MQFTRLPNSSERLPALTCLQNRCTGDFSLPSQQANVQIFKSDTQIFCRKRGNQRSAKRPISFGFHDPNHLAPGMRRLRASSDSRTSTSTEIDVEFPVDYSELLEQEILFALPHSNCHLIYIFEIYQHINSLHVKVATQSALMDSKHLLEIEFPTAGLDSVSGDAEGGIEMNSSMTLIREFCRRFLKPEEATRTRIFFPEAKEVEFAKKTVFEGVAFKMDYLTKPSLLEDFGFGTKVKMVKRVQPTDEMFLVAYPYFNVDEMLVVEELYKDAVVHTDRKLIIFNGELDRIRSGYYPPFFYPKIAALARNFLPKFETAYYIHNFKGRVGGTLFRSYPGPWQVLRKVGDKHVCIHQQETMPSLKEVALSILPSA